MSNEINLKAIERKAWKSVYQDGLFDIYLGFLLMWMGMLNLFEEIGLTDPWPMVIYIAGIVISMGVLWLGKRFITVPRIGYVKFGPKRKARKRKTALVLFLSVCIGFVVFLLAGAVSRGFASDLLWEVIIPVIYVLNMFIVFGLMAYFLDYHRFYLVGVMFALPLPLLYIARNFLGIDPAYWAFILPGLVIVLLGVISLIRFIKENPIPAIPSGELSNDGG